MNWATLSAWIGAGVALATALATIGREWWTRPQVDWTISGEVSQPDRLVPDFVEATVAVSNFGDGNAHRVAVYVRFAPTEDASLEATSPLLRPGDSVQITFRPPVKDWASTTIFITWTAPPIRRHREHTSVPQRVESLVRPPMGECRQALIAARQADGSARTDEAPEGPGAA